MRVELVNRQGGTLDVVQYPGMPRCGDLLNRGHLGLWVVLEVIWSTAGCPMLVIGLKPDAGTPLDLRPGDDTVQP